VPPVLYLQPGQRVTHVFFRECDGSELDK
jgi:hypothetical protein